MRESSSGSREDAIYTRTGQQGISHFHTSVRCVARRLIDRRVRRSERTYQLADPRNSAAPPLTAQARSNLSPTPLHCLRSSSCTVA